jgi:hypothetical protein
MKVLNAFSVSMVSSSTEEETSVTFRRVAPEHAAQCAREAVHCGWLESCVGHSDTALLFSGVLGVKIEARRAWIALQPGEMALLGQYTGPRLPEGATALPPGATIEWFLVTRARRLA